ncbi:MAG: hypothetical protein ACI3Y4_04455 [Candidatus Cryptobacteroides sp.]
MPSKVQLAASVLKSLVLNSQFLLSPSKTLILSEDCQLMAVFPSADAPIAALVPNPACEAVKLRVISPFWLSFPSDGTMFSFAQPANSRAAQANNNIFFISIFCFYSFQNDKYISAELLMQLLCLSICRMAIRFFPAGDANGLPPPLKLLSAPSGGRKRKNTGVFLLLG